MTHRMGRMLGRGVAILRVAVIAGAAAGAALAQEPQVDSATAPALELTPAQRQTIYQSVSTTQKNSAAPTGFRAAIGAHVPDSIELKPLPPTLAALIPSAASLEVGMVEKQVVLVDPKTKTVVAVVAHDS